MPTLPADQSASSLEKTRNTPGFFVSEESAGGGDYPGDGMTTDTVGSHVFLATIIKMQTTGITTSARSWLTFYFHDTGIIDHEKTHINLGIGRTEFHRIG